MDEKNQNFPENENPETLPDQGTIEFDAEELSRLKELAGSDPGEAGLTEPEDLYYGETEPLEPEGEPREDPLENADSLPDLFPGMEEPEEEIPAEPEPPVYEGPPTIVPRTPEKKKSAGRRVALVFRSLFKWALALVLAFAILGAGLLGYLTVAEYHPAYSEETRHGGQDVTLPFKGEEISVLTFNTGYAGLDQNTDSYLDGGKTVNPKDQKQVEANMEGIEEILRNSDADFLFLQEVDMDSKRSFGENQWIRYEHALKKYESRFALDFSCSYVPYPLKDFMGRIQSGIVTYSRYNIGSSTRFVITNPLSWPERIIRRRPCFTLTRIPTGTPEEQKPELVLINLHLTDCEGEEERNAQLDEIMAIMKEEYKKGNYVIAGGDFDQTFPDAEEFPLRKPDNPVPGKLNRLRGGWRYVYDDSIPTRRLADGAYDPYTAQCYVTDGFIVSPNLQVLSAETLNEGFAYSNHNPVLLKVRLT